MKRTNQGACACAGKLKKKKNKHLLFYCAMLFIPVLQFCIFYLGVNLKSILLAFSTYEMTETGYTLQYFNAGFSHFAAAINCLKEIDTLQFLSNSLTMIMCDLLVSLPLAIIFSYYIHKKYALSGFFKVILFIPQIVSVMVFSILFKFIANDLIASMTGVSGGILNNIETDVNFRTVIFYNIFVSFGTNIILFTGSMDSINTSIFEACRIDGASTIQEFFHIVVPMVWPTFSTFVVVSLTGLFVNQMNLYSLFSINADTDITTFGYLLYVAGQSAGLDSKGISALSLDYYELSALGLMFTAITVPIVLGARAFMKKLGPSVE